LGRCGIRDTSQPEASEQPDAAWRSRPESWHGRPGRENEVKLKEITGEIEAERMKSELLEMQKKNRHAEASIEGEVEAMRVSKFFDEVTERIPREERVDVFNLLRKKDILAELSQGNAQIFYTPSDVDLTLETHSSGRRVRPPSQ
jgi:hypothetical protein